MKKAPVSAHASKNSAQASRQRSSHTSAASAAPKKSAPKPSAPKSRAASKRKKSKPRLRTGRLVALIVAAAVVLGGGGYLLSHYHVFSTVTQMLTTDRTAEQTVVRHDREVAAIRKKNALDTVDGVKTFSDSELRQCFYSSDIDDKITQRLKNMGYTDQVPLEDLQYTRVLYEDFEGRTVVGELVVNKDIATKVENVFYDLYMHKYPIQKMILPDAYGTQISESFSDNNTVALCFGLSEDNEGESHELGYSIDLNPLYNPLIKDNGNTLSVYPMEGQLYLDRTINAAYYIHKDDYAVKAFEKEGFEWYGDRKGNNDYKHFEYKGTHTSHVKTSETEKSSTSEKAQSDEEQPQTEPEQTTPEESVEEPVYDEPSYEEPVQEEPPVTQPDPGQEPVQDEPVWNYPEEVPDPGYTGEETPGIPAEDQI